MAVEEGEPLRSEVCQQGILLGKETLCDRVIEIIRPDPNFRPKLLDLGCGEGRNAIYFARHGFKVTGLEKMRRYADEAGVHPEVRGQRFQDYSVFVEKPFIPRAPDAEENAFLYKSGELMGYFWDWEILYSAEEIFDCMSSGIPHRHAVNRIIARR